MKFSILKYPAGFFAIAFFVFSCGGTERKTPAKIDSVISSLVAKDSVHQDVVKKDSLHQIAVKKNLVVNDTTTQVSLAFKITGTVYYTLSYCGGARPTEELVKELATPKLLPNSILILRNKTSNFTIRTNEKGEFSADLPEGHLDVYFTKGTNWTILSGTANSCNNCLTQPISSVNIIKGKNARINIAFHCSPEDANRP